MRNFFRFLRRHKFLTFLLFLLILALFLNIFHEPILNSAGSFLVVSDRLEKADIIRVLGGSPDRYLYGADLFRRGYGKKIVFSFWDNYLPLVQKSMSQIVKEYTKSQGVPEDAVLIFDGVSTYQEAVITRDLIEREGYKSVIVVSSPYHMRRASIIFDYVIGKRAKLIYVPVPEAWTDFRAEGWWRDEEAAVSVLHEYISIIYYYLNYIIFR